MDPAGVLIYLGIYMICDNIDQFSQICKATIKEKGEKSGGDTWERLKGRLFEFQKYYEINTL